MFQIAAKANGYGGKDIILRIEALIRTKVPKIERYYTQRSEIDEMRAIKKIKTVWNAVSKGVFLSNEGTWLCKTCQYKTYCDSWFLNGDGDNSNE